jgi:nucleotide-binding universal stress UspA family protein
MPMKALVAIDGSERSWESLRQIAALLAPERDQVGLYYAPPRLQLRAKTDAPTDDVVERSRDMLAEAVFSKAGEHLPAALRASMHKVVGRQHQPREGILIAANQWQADLIVVGARGAGPIQSLLLGSVSRWVVHHATIPVLVTRPGTDHGSDSAFKVLLACGDTKLNEPTRRLVNGLSWPAQTQGRLMHVVEQSLLGEIPPWLEELARNSISEPGARALVEEFDAEMRRAKKALFDASRELPPAFRQFPPILEEGHAAERIHRVVTAEKIDLVVVGRRQVGARGRLLLGSTSEKVLNFAHCSVLVVCEPELL